MDHWVQFQAKDEAVKLLECPRCKAAVRSTVRYNRVINRSLKVVEQVKQRLRGEVSLRRNVFLFIFPSSQETPHVRGKLIEEIKSAVSSEAQAVDKEGKPLYTEEEKKKLTEFRKEILRPELVRTVHHLNNTKMVLSWLLIFTRLQLTIKKESLLVIKTNSTAWAAGLKLTNWSAEILAGIGKIEVNIINPVWDKTAFSLPRNCYCTA